MTTSLKSSLLQAVTSGANPIAIKKGIDKTCDFLVEKLRENAKPVQGTQDIKVPFPRACTSKQVASTSCPIFKEQDPT